MKILQNKILGNTIIFLQIRLQKLYARVQPITDVGITARVFTKFSWNLDIAEQFN